MWFPGGVSANASIEEQVISNVSRTAMNAAFSSGLRMSMGGEMEQFEHPDNRVSLGKERTSQGLLTTNIQVGVHDVNLQTRQEHVDTFVRILKTAGCRDASIETGALNPDGAHASATCRMSRSDTDGVVDPNLQVHGTDNLYVCSNAVFPSIAAANPTLTVSALAVRLATHFAAAD